MVLLPFLPGAVVGVWWAWASFSDKKYYWCFLTLLFYVPGVLLGTPLYMAFVMLTSCVKLFKPDFDNKEKLLCWLLDGEKVSPMLRMSEIVGESYPQSMLGEFSLDQACFACQIKSEVDQDDCHKHLFRHLHPDHPRSI